MREYGLDDGYRDGLRGDKPAVPLDEVGADEADEYDVAYVEGYRRGREDAGGGE